MRIRYVAAWLAVTACAVGLSWLGVRSVFGATLPQRFDLHAGLAAPTHTVVLTTSDTPTPTPTSASPTPTTTQATTTTAQATTTPRRTPDRPTPTPQKPPQEGAWVQEDGRQVYLRSFGLKGGTAGVRFAETGVEAVSATPGAGYSAQVERRGPHLVVVTFRSAAGASSRLEASWTGGPYWQVTESR
ncbi:hypothetical protein LX15_004139 [Streptoalloteichus tenebrarius]|uniref:Secreted protein n=1 Tax=Streptoalloteichus tenebrarius (strain ATCC 17920 / DSM 40477 / JCM 4838 / CBS 697.72 / NBRC 16177 / NCIMB 11028 / NRRL B-12390 / A12253. 1 / ISP 5477) TaxID=1933 RepID=A0ABT1HY31_STRSD|nr:hypothetical protein [Streptoalloteichus tenebrarius]MCP2260425.1 hypothetical protein [Streptoalloteichus tenebrarius]